MLQLTKVVNGYPALDENKYSKYHIFYSNTYINDKYILFIGYFEPYQNLPGYSGSSARPGSPPSGQLVVAKYMVSFLLHFSSETGR